MLKYLLLTFCVVFVILGCFGISKKSYQPLEVVHYVDLNRYLGQWYEIASYPNRFQKNCVGSRAFYKLREDGKLSVLNECYDVSFEGKLRSARGIAWVVDPTTNAKLKVSFFWPFSGDYWIIDLGENYEYAVIGHPKRKYLWILSRTKDMNEDVYNSILQRLKLKNYDVSLLVKTIHK